MKKIILLNCILFFITLLYPIFVQATKVDVFNLSTESINIT